ncbi:hypothetical protein L211DRAFT_854208, partial [Terfezia boudieri ATCC MYA-4762]
MDRGTAGLLTLEDSTHAVKGLSEEEAEELTKGLLEGQGHSKEEEDEDMEGEDEGTEDKRNSWKRIHEPRTELEVVESIRENAKVLEELAGLRKEERSWRSKQQGSVARNLIISGGESIEGGWCIDGTVEGRGGWKALPATEIARGKLDNALAVSEAERCWRQVLEVRPGVLRGLERELKEVREQLALLAVAMGAGTVEEQAKVQRTINARKGRVEEEKRKEKEVKKIEARRREAEAERKEEFKAQEEAVRVAAQAKAVRDSQQKAWDACEGTLEELAKRNRSKLDEDELISLGQKMKEAKAMKERIEKETRQLLETRVGRSRQVVNGEILKTVEVVVGHKQNIDSKGKAELETAVAKVNLSLRTIGITADRTAWAVTAKAGTGEFADESIWSVSKVAQEMDPLKVAREVGRMLVQAFGRTEEMLNVWVGEGSSVKMIVPTAPMVAARDRKSLALKLREENKDMVGGKRMPKAWGGARVTGFTFDAADTTEAI